MTKLTELQKKREEIKNQIKGLREEGKMAEAYASLDKLKEINKEIEIENALEQEEKNKNLGGMKKMENAINTSNVLKKIIRNKVVTEEEMTAYKNAVGAGQVEHVDEKGGYLVPTEQTTKILEFKRGLNPLKSYCDVIPVSTLKGNMPIEKEGAGELLAFEELNEIPSSSLDFGNLAWDVKDYGDIFPVSNTLLDDEKADLIGFIKGRFSKKAVRTENKKIIALIKSATIKQTGTTYDAITTALNTKLDTALRAGAVMFCSQTNFDWLDTQKATDGRPVLTPDLTSPTRMLYKGVPIVPVNDAEMGTSKAKEFYIGNMVEYVKFFDRSGISIAASDHAAFTKNATLLRVIERFDVQVADKNAMVKVEITAA